MHQLRDKLNSVIDHREHSSLDNVPTGVNTAKEMDRNNYIDISVGGEDLNAQSTVISSNLQHSN